MEHLVLQLFRSARGRLVASGLLTLLGAGFCSIAWPAVVDARRLRASRAEVDAEVVESRATRDQHLMLEHAIRYRFRVAGAGTWFARDEPATGRTDLWSTLPEPDWERARASGRVRVAYLPADPRVNRPLAVEDRSGTDATAGLVLGAICLGGGAVWLAAQVSRAVACGGPLCSPPRRGASADADAV